MWLGHHFQGQKVKGQGHQAGLLLNAALTREAGAAVTVRTNWAWETTATFPSAGRRARRWGAHGEERGGEAYCVATRTACYYFYYYYRERYLQCCHHDHKVIARVHSVHLMNVEQRQAAADPQTKPTDLGCVSFCRLLSSTTYNTVAVATAS